METIIIIWLLCGIIAGVIASNRGGNGFMWFIGGILFGPIGVLFSLTVGQKCTKCGKKIPSSAKVCPYCGVKFVSRKEFARIQAAKKQKQAAMAQQRAAASADTEQV